MSVWPKSASDSAFAKPARQRWLWLLVAVTVCMLGALAFLFLALKPVRGDQIHIVRNPQAGTVTAYVVFDLQNATGQPGLAHYTEHLVWLNAISGDRAADRHSNAWTNRYTVGYRLSGPPEALPDLLTQLRAVFNPLTLAGDFAHEERSIVAREYDFRLGDNPAGQAAEQLNSFLYAGHPMAASVIGTPAEIARFTYRAARDYHAATHQPSKAVLVVTGDVSAWALRAALQAANWPDMTAGHRLPAPAAFTPGSAISTTFERPSDSASPQLIWRKIVTLPDPVPFDRLAAESAFLSDVLTSNLPGGLAGPLRFDAAVTRSFGITIWPLSERAVEIHFTAEPDRGVTLDAIAAKLEQALAASADAGISGETYMRIKRRFEGYWPDWGDPEDRGAWMADYVIDTVATGRVPLSARALKRLSGDVPRQRVNTLLQQIAGDGRTASAYIGPKEIFR